MSNFESTEEYVAYLEGMNSYLKAELQAARSQGGEVEPVAEWAETVNRIVPDLSPEPDQARYPAEWSLWADRKRIRRALLSHPPVPTQGVPEVPTRIMCEAGSCVPHRDGQSHDEWVREIYLAMVDAAPNHTGGEWVRCDERLPKPEQNVLATFINDNGKRRTICAHYVPRWTVESDGEEDTYDEYSEEKDEYYLCEGWYENIENWGDFSAVHVCEGEVTHWQPMLQPPKDQAQENN